MDPVRPLEDAV